MIHISKTQKQRSLSDERIALLKAHPPRFLEVWEVVIVYSRCERLVREDISQRRYKVIKNGKKFLIPREAIEGFFEKLAIQEGGK